MWNCAAWNHNTPYTWNGTCDHPDDTLPEGSISFGDLIIKGPDVCPNGCKDEAMCPTSVDYFNPPNRVLATHDIPRDHGELCYSDRFRRKVLCFSGTLCACSWCELDKKVDIIKGKLRNKDQVLRYKFCPDLYNIEECEPQEVPNGPYPNVAPFNTTPGGSAFSDSFFDAGTSWDRSPERAFDNGSLWWQKGNVSSGHPLDDGPGYIGRQFPYDMTISSFEVWFLNSAYSSTNFHLQASPDGISWTNILTGMNYASFGSTTGGYSFPPTTARHWRLYFEQGSGVSGTRGPATREFRLFGYKTPEACDRQLLSSGAREHVATWISTESTFEKKTARNISWIEYELFFLCLTPFGTDPGYTSQDFYSVSTGGVCTSMEHSGNAWAKPIATIVFSQASNVSGVRFTLVNSGKCIEVPYDFNPGDVLIIDAERQIVTVNSIPVLFNGDTFYFEPGANNVCIDIIGGSSVFTAGIKHLNAWL